MRRIKTWNKGKKINVLVPSILFLTYTHTYIIHTLQKESKLNVYNHLLTRLFPKNYETKFTRCNKKTFPTIFIFIVG